MTVLEELRQARERRQRLHSELDHLVARDGAGIEERRSNLNVAIERTDARIAELEHDERTHAYLRSISGDPAHSEAGATFGSEDRRGDRGGERPGQDMLSEALRANERASFLPEQSRAHMEHQLRSDDDPTQRLAAFVVELSDRDYFRAFASWLRDPVSGGHEWTPDERDSVRRVRHLERALGLGAQGGGYLVPYELDPAILLAGTGYVDPMRSVSRVDTTAQNIKKYVTSLGVTSHWYAESAETSDDTPTLLQPSITCHKATAYCAVTFELFEDSDIATQLANVFADSKAAEEARVFTTGNGTTEPKGVITAVAGVAGSVIATGTNVLANTDPPANQAALPPRWRGNAKFMCNLSIINGYRALIKATGMTESLVDDSGSTPRMYGWEIVENSNMDGTLGAGTDDLLLSGDFRQFAILDRIGTMIIRNPVVVGANQRPTGETGYLMHWRVGSDTLIPDAFRLTNYSG